MSSQQMKIAYIVLAHQDPDNVARLVKRLVDADGTAMIHYDLNAPKEEYQALKEELASHSDALFCAERVAVSWGKWSMIEATLNCLREIKNLNVNPHYVHLMSGVDYPIHSLQEFQAFLSENDTTDFIECCNITNGKWVTGGLSHDRYKYKHYFNYQKYPKLFGYSYHLQRLLGLTRAFPHKLTPHMGSQWWTLTWSTCLKILEASNDNALLEFFKTVWIPDEMYFQTLVPTLVAPENLSSKHLTLYQFNDLGKPVLFSNGHEGYLIKQPFFFARKFQKQASELRDQLDENAQKNLSSVDKSIDSVGNRTDDHPVFLDMFAQSEKGKRIIGKPAKDTWYGDLEWNKRPYIVVAGSNAEELRLMAALLNSINGILCHNELFAEDSIGFIDGQEHYAGYSSEHVALRDYNKMAFLTQIVQEDKDNVVAFLLPFGDGKDEDTDIGEVTLWDKNANYIVLECNPLRSYLGKKKNSIDTTHNTAGHPLLKNKDEVIAEDICQFQKMYSKQMEHYHEYSRKIQSIETANNMVLSFNEKNWLESLLDFLQEQILPLPQTGSTRAQQKAQLSQTLLHTLSEAIKNLQDPLEHAALSEQLIAVMDENDRIRFGGQEPLESATTTAAKEAAKEARNK